MTDKGLPEPLTAAARCFPLFSFLKCGRKVFVKKKRVCWSNTRPQRWTIPTLSPRLLGKLERPLIRNTPYFVMPQKRPVAVHWIHGIASTTIPKNMAAEAKVGNELLRGDDFGGRVLRCHDDAARRACELH